MPWLRLRMTSWPISTNSLRGTFPMRRDRWWKSRSPWCPFERKERRMRTPTSSNMSTRLLDLADKKLSLKKRMRMASTRTMTSKKATKTWTFWLSTRHPTRRIWVKASLQSARRVAPAFPRCPQLQIFALVSLGRRALDRHGHPARGFPDLPVHGLEQLAEWVRGQACHCTPFSQKMRTSRTRRSRLAVRQLSRLRGKSLSSSRDLALAAMSFSPTDCKS
mmetsp:Transcript_62254/g.110659  ORF Transcript_62254/g.110659 Transcript_62254/m.110659 type:complete len:220 (-) Transcript_62254:141-800(-)